MTERDGMGSEEDSIYWRRKEGRKEGGAKAWTELPPFNSGETSGKVLNSFQGRFFFPSYYGWQGKFCILATF